MQSANNRRPLLIASLVVFIILVIVGLGLALFLGHSTKKAAGPGGEYTDPLSHEVVSNPSGKTPETYGTNAKTPLFLGFDKLIGAGLSLDQLRNVETAFDNYSASLPKPISQISLDVDHITTDNNATDPNAAFEMHLEVQFDQKTFYQIKIQYYTLNDIELFILDNSTSKLIYDSQILYTSAQSD